MIAYKRICRDCRKGRDISLVELWGRCILCKLGLGILL